MGEAEIKALQSLGHDLRLGDAVVTGDCFLEGERNTVDQIRELTQ